MQKESQRCIVLSRNERADTRVGIQVCDLFGEYCSEPERTAYINGGITSRPWEAVATDLFVLNGDDDLLVVDYYSRYPEIEKLENTLSSTIIRKLKTIFARHGIPGDVVSDNGPQYSSMEFARFAAEWDSRHTTSSPR